jgi:hypothetical protein
MQDPVSKITKTKRVGDMAQVVKLLASKCKALSSNSSTIPPKQPKNQNQKNPYSVQLIYTNKKDAKIGMELHFIVYNSL